jgi:putative DNA primase/helicase
LGLQLFPLHYPVARDGALWCSCGDRACTSPAKHPVARLVPHGLLDASAEPAAIERWWGSGQRHNIAISCGASGIVALDVDPRHQGDSTLARLEETFGPLPPTWRVLSGGGGVHHYFRHPGPKVMNSTSRVGAGLDVRADGGYVVAPGSVHISGRRYEIDVDAHPDDVGLSDVPAWLLRLMMSGSDPLRGNGVPAAALPESWQRLVAEGVSQGQRNDAVARLAGHLLRRNVSARVVLDLMRCWNRERCKPPLDDTELAKTVNSIAQRELKQRGVSS